MIKKEKNKLKVQSKILVLGLILIVLVGILSTATRVRAVVDDPLGTCKFYGSNGIDVEFARNKKVDCDAKGNRLVTPWKESTLTQYEAEVAKYNAIGTCITKNPNGEITKREKIIKAECDRPLGGETKRWIPDNRENMLGVCEDNNKKLIDGNITKKICEELLLGIWRLSAADAADLGEDIPPTAGGTPPKPNDDFVGPKDPYYHFLAPLPGLGTTFDPTQANNLGAYLNILINLFIGICAVLAVIMIVMGGLEYMTSELISSKEHGKERITGAIFGLILALGAWTLLYQINPDLLNTDLTSLKNVEVVVNLEEDVETAATAQTQSDPITGVSTTEQCTEGIVQISTSGGNINLCKRISENVKQMIESAKQSNIKLSGGGFRSKARQEALRAKNCGSSNVYNEKAKCNPLTAFPGKSRHENGLAIDFKCDGTLIQTSDNKCFVWLKANASKYGLMNLPQEPWHWSIDGR
jgi:LAS superfamily LD-carboxypeptidase LdcB